MLGAEGPFECGPVGITATVRPMAGNPFTDPDWASTTTDQIDRLVGKVRDNVTNNVVRVIRGLVFGIVVVLLAIVLAVIALIMVTRALQALIGLATTEGRAVYLSYLIVGGVFCAAGAMLMGRRRSGS